MPRAGQRLLSQDFPEHDYSVSTNTFEISGSYGEFQTSGNVVSGTYEDVSVIFTAPTSGYSMLIYSAEMCKFGTGASTVRISPEVREGGTVGSGSIVLATSVNRSIAVMAEESGDDDNQGTLRHNMSRCNVQLLYGMTPGNTYNVRLLHRLSSGTDASIRLRRMMVSPLT